MTRVHHTKMDPPEQKAEVTWRCPARDGEPEKVYLGVSTGGGDQLILISCNEILIILIKCKRLNRVL